ncbi:unnamed protein product [Acanthoscelides obtectus]|uniref:Uncharacterized protein n=1 Tax=Acanthoscelides obtectus TaxID=200917 RepID=A0A9P0L0T2_ACAOB|nr:unnamed protein product [Acanthoscelides obtectus]CAK1648265.1 hypothetical protein AOBTE_LOCUS15626 [Acanthoscelides obtectus]
MFALAVEKREAGDYSKLRQPTSQQYSGISDYCENSPDRMMMIARNYDLSLPVTKSLIQTATKFRRQLSIRESLGPDLQKRKVTYKICIQSALREKWQGKALHGQYVTRILQNHNLSKEDTVRWLTRANLPETPDE